MKFFEDLWLTRRPLAGFLLIGLAWAAFFAQMPQIKANIGASDGAYGTVLLLSSCGALMAMWLAPLAERTLGRWSLPLAGMGVAFGMLGAGLTSDIVVFGLAMGLAAMGAGVVDVLVNVRVSETETRTGRSLMNLNHGVYSLAYAGSAVLVGLSREAGFTPGQIFSVLLLLCAVLAAVMLPRRTIEVPEPVAPGGAAFPRGLVWMIGLLVLASFLVESAAEGWSALHLERTLGGGPAEGALGPAILGLTMGIGRLTGHFVGHRWRDLHVMAAGLALAVLGLALVAAAPDLNVAYAGFALTGLGVSVIAPLALAALGRSVAPQVRLQAISYASVLGYGAFFLGPPLMGLISEALGLRAAFATVGLLLALAALFLLPALARSVQRAGA
jgi:MFS family permease